MALLKSFTDACGNTYAQSYWRAVQINISSASREIYLVFYAYKDGQAFAEGKSPLPGAMKSYRVTGEEFLALAQEPSMGTVYNILADMSESYALAKKDTLDPDALPTEGDEGPVLVSFFEGATQV